MNIEEKNLKRTLISKGMIEEAILLEKISTENIDLVIKYYVKEKHFYEAFIFLKKIKNIPISDETIKFLFVSLKEEKDFIKIVELIEMFPTSVKKEEIEDLIKNQLLREKWYLNSAIKLMKITPISMEIMDLIIKKCLEMGWIQVAINLSKEFRKRTLDKEECILALKSIK